MSTQEQAKQLVDSVGVIITGATFMEYLPPATAILTFIWVAVRLWETETVKKLTGRHILQH